jgi:uncharacterized membrane protein YfhO
VRFETDDPNAVALSMNLDDPGLLVLSDSYYPGWRAWADGEPADIHRVNYGFRGIVVPAGRHTVEMRYEPASFRVGLFVSLLGLAALVGAGAAVYPFGRARAAAMASRS